MEPKILSCPPKITPCLGAFPVFLSYKSSLLQKPKPQFASSQLSVSGHHLEKTYFLGRRLDFEVKIESLGDLRKTRLPVSPISATVKRRKEMSFDNVIQRDKKLKIVLTIRKLLMSQPDKIMSLRQLGKFRRALGLQKKRRVIVLLKNFPAVFKIVEEGAYSLKFTLTPEAERLYLEELQARNEMEGLLVIKLRKLLMMSLDKRILLEKIAHLRTDLGLPLEFRNTICLRYPQYFKVIATERGPALELTHWDPQLAVSTAERNEEENKKREREERDLIIDREPRFNRVKLPKGLNLSKKEMKRMCQFRDMPYISPYSDFSMLSRGSPEKEKHACGVVHEILSLTVEKRTLVDHLTHFRDEFRFSQQLRGMLIRHPNMFYVSLKGARDSVFLREAYHRSELMEKDRLLLIKEKMRSLVSVERHAWRNLKSSDTDYSNKPEGGEEPGIDKLIKDDGFDEEEDEDGDFEDEWSDDGDDDLPPGFNDDDDDDDDDDDEYMNVESAKPRRKVDDPKKEEGVRIPVFPDGCPRERW